MADGAGGTAGSSSEAAPTCENRGYPDRETAHWCTQQVITRNEQTVHRWLAQGTRV
ncbi:RNase A-like domain-containing protein, partial [Streptomyces griseus]